MEPRRNLEFLLGVTMFLAVVFLLFELYWFLLLPASLMIAGLFSERLTSLFVITFKRSGSFVTGILGKLLLSVLFLFVLLPIAITQGLISKF